MTWNEFKTEVDRQIKEGGVKRIMQSLMWISGCLIIYGSTNIWTLSGVVLLILSRDIRYNYLFGLGGGK